MAGDEVRINVRVSDQTGPGFTSVARSMQGVRRSAAGLVGALGSSSVGLGGALKGVAAVVGAAALPAMGALVPMLAGVGAAAATAKLAFGGVGEAVGLAGEDSEEYAKALKKMGPEQAEFTKTVVSAKKEFAGFGKEIQKIALPSFTRALRDAAPVAGVVKDGMRDMAGSFAMFGDEFGKLFGSNQFQDALRRNMSMGAGFVGQMAAPMATLTQSILDFGAASKPTLDSFSRGIGDLMSKGLPGFFTGLQDGIKGSAAMFDGLFDGVNRLLPAFGELAGAIADSLGPLLGEMFRTIGGRGAAAMEALAAGFKAAKPLFDDLTYVVRIGNQAFSLFWSVVKNAAGVIVDSLVPAFGQVDQARGPFERLAGWLRDNQGALQSFAVSASNMIIDFVTVAVESLPLVIKGFRLMTTGILTYLDVIVSGLAKIWGWVPGLGPKLKRANQAFDKFKDGFIDSLDEAEDVSRDFAAKVGPRLTRNKLKMNIRQWNDQIATAKRRMKSVPPEKRAKLKADIADLQAKVRRAKGQIRSLKGKTVTIRTNYVTNYKTTGSLVPRGPTGAPLMRAAGGLVGGHAQEGGARSALTMVGEQGPELVRLPFGSQVRSNPDTRRLMSGGGRREPIVLEIRSGGSRLDDLLVEVLKKAIRTRGGNVQTVLGR